MNPGYVIIAAPNKPRRTIERMGEPELKELQEWVGGYIELVYHGRDANGEQVQFLVDEDGLSKRLEPNPDGNILFKETFGEDFPQIFVGPCVLLKGKAVMT